MSKGSRARRKTARSIHRERLSRGQAKARIRRLREKGIQKKLVPPRPIYFGDPIFLIPSEYNPQYYSFNSTSNTSAGLILR